MKHKADKICVSNFILYPFAFILSKHELFQTLLPACVDSRSPLFIESENFIRLWVGALHPGRTHGHAWHP
jgi:hypothetical protein